MVDASAWAEYLLGSSRGELLRPAIETPGIDLHVPALCDIEVASVLRKGMLAELLSEKRALEAMRDYLDLPLTRHGHQALLPAVLALRDNFSAYDATYLSLARDLGASFVTADGRLARAARRHLTLTVLT